MPVVVEAALAQYLSSHSDDDEPSSQASHLPPLPSSSRNHRAAICWPFLPASDGRADVSQPTRDVGARISGGEVIESEPLPVPTLDPPRDALSPALASFVTSNIGEARPPRMTTLPLQALTECPERGASECANTHRRRVLRSFQHARFRDEIARAQR